MPESRTRYQQETIIDVSTEEFMRFIEALQDLVPIDGLVVTCRVSSDHWILGKRLRLSGDQAAL